MFLTGVSLAVAAIPEGLPAIVTIALALGVQRMIRKNAIIRHLPAVETLGSATVVCTDKTGTLTQNRMAVRAAWAAGRSYGLEDPADAPLRRALEAVVLCCDAGPEDGDPTESALVRAAFAEGLRPAVPRRGVVPFEPERRRMAVVCGTRLIVKGAVEEVLARCTGVAGALGRAPLDGAARASVREAAERLAGQAFRVLAVAERDLGWSESGGAGAPPGRPRADDALDPATVAALEHDLTLLGLFALIDPPRPEARDAVARCQAAGIRVVMITGDHALTARAIAEQVGLLGLGARVVTGEELGSWSDRDLQRQVEHVRVYARVSPADKLRIVRAWKARGHVVAMTGDGVNDAPAVREAHIGVAMGRDGTDVTREASAMVLTDDDFATIVAAIEEGRAIHDNIRKFIRYLLACNTGEILVMLLGTLAGLPLPLLPLQMLLVNLVTDGLPALALGVDPPSADVMRRPPRRPDEGPFARGLGRLIAVRGLVIGLCTLGVFALALGAGASLPLARTTAMCTLVVSQLLHAFDARSEAPLAGLSRLFVNRALLAAVASSLAVLLLALYAAPLASVFRAVPLGAAEWAAVVIASLAGAVLAALFDVVRFARRRRRRRSLPLAA